MSLRGPRREFLTLSGWAAADTAGVLAAAGPGTAPTTAAETTGEAKSIPLEFARYEYDRLAALADGRVSAAADQLARGK